MNECVEYEKEDIASERGYNYCYEARAVLKVWECRSNEYKTG